MPRKVRETVVSEAGRSVGIPSCSPAPRHAAPPCAASTRPAPTLIYPSFGSDKSSRTLFSIFEVAPRLVRPILDPFFRAEDRRSKRCSSKIGTKSFEDGKDFFKDKDGGSSNNIFLPSLFDLENRRTSPLCSIFGARDLVNDRYRLRRSSQERRACCFVDI